MLGLSFSRNGCHDVSIAVLMKVVRSTTNTSGLIARDFYTHLQALQMRGILLRHVGLRADKKGEAMQMKSTLESQPLLLQLLLPFRHWCCGQDFFLCVCVRACECYTKQPLLPWCHSSYLLLVINSSVTSQKVDTLVARNHLVVWERFFQNTSHSLKLHNLLHAHFVTVCKGI